jgi:hypothetical protein
MNVVILRAFAFVGSGLLTLLLAADTRVKRADLPKALLNEITTFVQGHYQSGCETEDTFEWLQIDSSFTGDQYNSLQQVGGFTWFVRREKLTEADRRNGIEFRGTLVLTGTVSRTYDFKREAWGAWLNGGEFRRFYLSKSKGTSWRIAADSPNTEYKKASCESIRKFLKAGKPENKR